MSNIPYELICAEEGKVITANGVSFSPFADKPYHFSINRIPRNGENEATGQTRLNRYPALFGAAVKCIQSARPDTVKNILSAPSSVGAEAMSLAAKTYAMGVLDQFRFDCIDINELFIRHAKSYQLPAAMLIRQAGWLQDAFQIPSQPLNDQALWVEPINEIRKAVTVYDPVDATNFKADKKYDIIFMMTIFEHLTKTQQTALLGNMALQCNGLLCFDMKPAKLGGTVKDTLEKGAERSARVQDILSREGYVTADPFSTTIKPCNVKLTDTMTRSLKGFVPSADLSGAIVAIHPDLAAEMA